MVPTKRKQVSSNEPHKRPRSMSHGSASEPKRCFPLLDLPIEILDLVLSHVITVPWHPELGVLRSYVFEDLLPKEIFHVSRLLRQRTIQVISRSVLWIEVKCRTRLSIRGVGMDSLKTALPVLPPIYRNLLTDPLQKIVLEFGDPAQTLRTTRGLKEENAAILFPFNYQSLAFLSSRLVICSESIGHVKIHLSQLSAPFERIYKVQFRPMAHYARYIHDVEIIHASGECEKIPTEDMNAHDGSSRQILEVVAMVRDLDQNGLKLEATILCMYQGLLLKIIAELGPDVGRLASWLSSDGPLSSSDWQTDTFNVDRMKIIRSLHYIEHRACLGYVEAAHTYGYYFARTHYKLLTNLPMFSVGNVRWQNRMNNFLYGLPDHELAEVHFGRALILQHIWENYHNFSRDGLLSDDSSFSAHDTAVAAMTWAYYAWSLDMACIRYKKLLLDLEDNCGPDVVADVHRYVQAFDNSDSSLGTDPTKTLHFRIHPKIVQDWMSFSEHALEYHGRAQEVAKLADVQYDQPKRGSLPNGTTRESRRAQKALFCKRLKKARGSDTVRADLNIDILVTEYDFWDGDYYQEFSDIAPWSDDGPIDSYSADY